MLIPIVVSDKYLSFESLVIYVSEKSIQITLPENYQLWERCFDSLLKLYIHVIVRETGQIYHTEKYIINEEDILVKLVRQRT